jgi:hypothetical protein
MTHGPSPRPAGSTGAAPARRRRLALLGLAAVVVLLGASCKYLDPANRPSTVPGATNGQLPLSYLDAVGSCTVYDEAAPSLRAMIEQAAVDGITLRPTSCYRDYAGQVAARQYWCGLGACHMAAVPGTSNHGWGKAIDLGDQNGTLTFDSAGYEWMLTWGWYYGWVHPASMKEDGPVPEAWHFEGLGDGGKMYPGEYWGLGTTPPTEPRGLPMGSLDGAAASPGSITVGGWAIDPDQVASIPVRVRVDGQVLATVTADVPRPDVAAAFPLYAAADHGFQTTVGVAPGPHTVCVDAVNVSGAGWDRELRCVDLVVP